MGGEQDKRVTLAAVAGAHGVRGEVRLKLFGDEASALEKLGRLFVGGERRKLKSLKTGGKMPVAKFEGVNDRGAAEALRGQLVEADRNQLPELDEGEYYHADLLGLAVVDNEGAAVGTIVAVENYGASDVVEIERPNGKRFMVPLTEQAVPEWDDERLVITKAFAEEE